MTFDVLAYCLDIADTKSFTRSAENNHISQQALSQQVKNLEAEIGIQLFERTNRSVQVTPAGEVFLNKVRDAVNIVSSAVQYAESYKAGQKGFLSLGYNGPSSQRYISAVLLEFTKKYPDIEVTLKSGTNQEITKGFFSGEFDIIALGDFVEFDSEICETKKWEAGTTCAVFGRSHRFANNETVTPEQLLGETYISLDFRDNPYMFERTMTRCRNILGEIPRKIRFVDKTETVDILVSCGIGYTLLNGDLKGYYKDSLLSFVDIAGATCKHHHKFVWKKNKKSAAIDKFIDTADCVFSNKIAD